MGRAEGGRWLVSATIPSVGFLLAPIFGVRVIKYISVRAQRQVLFGRRSKVSPPDWSDATPQAGSLDVRSEGRARPLRRYLTAAQPPLHLCVDFYLFISFFLIAASTPDGPLSLFPPAELDTAQPVIEQVFS